MRMARTSDAEKESERTGSEQAALSHLLGAFCGELLISKVLWVTRR